MSEKAPIRVVVKRKDLNLPRVRVRVPGVRVIPNKKKQVKVKHKKQGDDWDCGQFFNNFVDGH